MNEIKSIIRTCTVCALTFCLGAPPAWAGDDPPSFSAVAARKGNLGGDAAPGSSAYPDFVAQDSAAAPRTSPAPGKTPDTPPKTASLGETPAANLVSPPPGPRPGPIQGVAPRGPRVEPVFTSGPSI